MVSTAPSRPLDKVVVVTGASSGIGRATARMLAERGATVVLVARGKEALDAAVEECGPRAVGIPADVCEPTEMRAVAAETVARFGRLDAWVNNASVSLWARVEDTTPEEYDRVMRVNFLGHVNGVHAALPHLRENGGVIVGIASLVAIRALPLMSAYVASKWAVRGFYDALRVELQRDGVPVKVTTILPPSVDTPLFANARSKLGALPRPVPPVYAPEVVARAIVRAVEKPTREVPVGGAAAAILLSQRFAPALTDRVMRTGGLIFKAQRSGDPDDGLDNLDAPLPGAGAVRGTFDGPVAKRSPYTSLVGQRPVVTRVAQAVAGGLLLRRLLRTR